MKKNSKIWAVAALVFALALSAVACGNSSSGTSASGTGADESGNTDASVSAENEDVTPILIATMGAPSPFVITNDDGSLSGYDVEVIEEIFSRLPQYEISFETTENASIFTGIDAGYYQLGMNHLGYTTQRGEKYILSDIYYRDEPALLVRDDNDEIQSVQDIVGHTTEVASVSYMTDIYNNYNDAHPDEQIDLVYVDDVSNTPLNVSEGRVDFELFTKLTLQNQIESAGLDNVKLIDVSLEDYDFLTGGDEGINGTFFLAAKGNEQLIEDMNEAFEAAVEDGSIAKINEKYLGQSDEYAITLDYIEHVKELVQKDVEENGGQEDE